MKTVVLDDDPTGTQSASDVQVLFYYDFDAILNALKKADSVFLQTNSRAISEDRAVSLMDRIRRDIKHVEERLGEPIRVVLRGDSTLRGHVFSETARMLGASDVILFVPAFPAGGRVTIEGTHLIRTIGGDLPVSDSEYARDPVFPFATSNLVEYVAQKSGRAAIAVPLEELHVPGRLAHKLVDSEPGSVVIPDAITDDDVRMIATEVEVAERLGAHVVVRCASPLAAALAGVQSAGLLALPESARAGLRVLVVCGSHTYGATRQLAELAHHYGEPVTLDVNAALVHPEGTGIAASQLVQLQLRDRGIGILASGRDRSLSHGTLEHGELVMKSLTSAVRELRSDVDVVIAKGGITSSEVARVGLGSTAATVHGQILPGISEWELAVDGRPLTYVVVPGNVGGDAALLNAVDRYRP